MTGPAMHADLLCLPASTEEAATAFLTAALRACGAIAEEVSVTGIDHQQIAVGVSISGQLARLSLTYTPASHGPATVIFKLPPTAPENRALGTGFLMYEREGLFYGEFADLVPMRKPRCYWSRVDAEAHLPDCCWRTSATGPRAVRSRAPPCPRRTPP